MAPSGAAIDAVDASREAGESSGNARQDGELALTNSFFLLTENEGGAERQRAPACRAGFSGLRNGGAEKLWEAIVRHRAPPAATSRHRGPLRKLTNNY